MRILSFSVNIQFEAPTAVDGDTSPEQFLGAVVAAVLYYAAHLHQQIWDSTIDCIRL